MIIYRDTIRSQHGEYGVRTMLVDGNKYLTVTDLDGVRMLQQNTYGNQGAASRTHEQHVAAVQEKIHGRDYWR